MRARIKGTNTLIDVNWIDGDNFKDCRTGAQLYREQLEFIDLAPIGPLTIERPPEPNWRK